jgi:molybdopterin-binding protein
MKISARNVLKGRIIDIKAGPVAARVRVDIGGGHVVTSSILAESLEDLGIVVGDEVSVIIKSSDVMIGK